MSCPNVQQWDLLSMELIDSGKTDQLLTHARQCDSCRDLLRRARQDHARLLRAFEVFDRDHERLREELLAAVPVELRQRAQPSWRLRLRDSIGSVAMSLNTTNRRVAAVLLSAACIFLVLLVLLVPGRSGVAFAQVLEHMRRARTMVCDVVMVSRTVFEAEDRSEEQTFRQKYRMYSDGATYVGRIDQADPPSTVWTFPDHMVKIDAEGKQTVIRFAEQPVPRTLYESPAWWHDRLLKLTEAPDRELGRQMLDGREVVGFEIAGWKLGYGTRPTPGADTTAAPAAVVRLWVDVGTRLPVRMQVEHVMVVQMAGVFSMKVSQTWEHIKYDLPLDPQLFQPPPAVAGEPVEDSHQGELLRAMLSPSEEKLLDALRAYPDQIKELFPEPFLENLPRLTELMEQAPPDDAEAAQARTVMAGVLELLHGYPPQIDPSFLASVALKVSIVAPSLERAHELTLRARGDPDALARWADEREAAAGNAEAAARLAEKQAPARKELENKLKELSRSIVAMQGFYHQLLSQDREPEYFGATVKPGDSDAVLMRWKLDDKHWRVIYGDLRTETIPRE
jgi:hypothetical protein